MSKDQSLRYMSNAVLGSLKENVAQNLDRYTGDGFADMAAGEGWGIESDISFDASLLETLDSRAGAQYEMKNSVIIWKALHHLPAALATEDRIWSRLSHVECFEFSRNRWIKTESDPEKLGKLIRTHFFAPSLTRFRDDHAIGRLWWNAYVAKQLMPQNQERALELILSKADTRLNLVERSMSFGRLNVGQAILRIMDKQPDIVGSESGFRDFMKAVNRYGGGIVFEALTDSACDKFMETCWEKAQQGHRRSVVARSS